MTCAACSTRIEKGLSRMDGVKSASVNLTGETGTVEYDPAVVTVSDILKKIEKLGYTGSVRQDREKKKSIKEEEIASKKRKLILSIVLSLPLLYTMIGHMPLNLGFQVPGLLMNPWFQMLFATVVQI
jgi:Cu+-exporting ATPase